MMSNNNTLQARIEALQARLVRTVSYTKRQRIQRKIRELQAVMGSNKTVDDILAEFREVKEAIIRREEELARMRNGKAPRQDRVRTLKRLTGITWKDEE